MKLLLPCLLAFFLLGCSTSQEEEGFKLGKEVNPPVGCEDYRKRGGKC